MSDDDRLSILRRTLAPLVRVVVAVVVALSVVIVGSTSSLADDWWYSYQGQWVVSAFPTIDRPGSVDRIHLDGITISGGTASAYDLQVNAYCAADPGESAAASPTTNTSSAPSGWQQSTVYTGDYDDGSRIFRSNPATDTTITTGYFDCPSSTYPNAVGLRINAGPTGPTWIDLRAEFVDVEVDCGSGILSDVYVWETDENVGYSFKWTGSTDWSRWAIHVPGSPMSVYGDLEGYVTAGAAPSYWRDDNDPVTASLFDAGDTVRFRRYSADGLSATACYAEVVVQSFPHDWTEHSPSALPGGGGDATDPDTDEDCSTWDIVCRIKAALVWAFVPSEGVMDGWSTRISSISSSPPLSFVLFGLGIAEELWTGFGCLDPDTVCGSGGYTAVDSSFDVAGISFDWMDERDSVATSDAYQWVYVALVWLVWLGFVVWAFRRVSRSFGSKEQEE